MFSRRAAAVVAATATAFFGVEMGLRLFAPQPMSSSWLTMSERGYAINRASTETIDAIPGRSALYRINSLGFRGEEPGSSGRRVLVVGDSVTFGLLLNESDSYVSRIASSAAAEFGSGQISFLNAAVAGWGAADYVAFIEDRGDELRPDAVLVFVGYDDVRRAEVSPLWHRSPDGGLSRSDYQYVRSGLQRIPLLPGYRFMVEHSHAAQLLRRAAIRTISEPVMEQLVDPDQALALTEGLFVRLAAWCRSRGIALLVTNGTLFEFSGKYDRSDPNVTFFENAVPFFARLSVPYLPVAMAHGPLSEPLSSLIIPDDGHPNERGAGLIFETVWPWLRAQLKSLL
jgi:lysophospholipase L1-like esterase